jgi:predicted kinase
VDHRKKIRPATATADLSPRPDAVPDFQAMSDEQLRLIVAGSRIYSDNWRHAKAALQERADRRADRRLIGLTNADLRRREHRRGYLLLTFVVLFVISLIAVFHG